MTIIALIAAIWGLFSFLIAMAFGLSFWAGLGFFVFIPFAGYVATLVTLRFLPLPWPFSE